MMQLPELRKQGLCDKNIYTRNHNHRDGPAGHENFQIILRFDINSSYSSLLLTTATLSLIVITLEYVITRGQCH